MERAEQAMVEEVINHEIKERFTLGAVQRAVLLQRGDDPAIEPGQLMVRVFIPSSDEPPEQALAAWQNAHQAGIDEFRRERPGCSSSPLPGPVTTGRGSACRTTGRWPPSSYPGARS